MGLNLLPRYHIKIWAELQIRSMRHLKGTIKRFCNVTELQVIRFPGMLGEVGFLQRKFQVLRLGSETGIWDYYGLWQLCLLTAVNYEKSQNTFDILQTNLRRLLMY